MGYGHTRSLLLAACLATACNAGTDTDTQVADPQVEEERVDFDYPPPSDDVLDIFAQPYTYPYQDCVDLPAGHDIPAESVTVTEDGTEQLCVWQNAQGCTPTGTHFDDYGSCEVAMTTSARFYKYPGYKTQTSADVLDDPAWVEESEWILEEFRACGCICCHDSKQGYEDGFATAFDVSAEGVWTDTFTDFGILTAAGVIDTTLLGGSFAPETNHGFDRNHTIFPTTDVERMKAFFQGESDRRGLTDERIQELIDQVPLRFAGLYTNYTEETQACGAGEGVDVDGTIHWASETEARYVYILEEGAANVADPPGLDKPEGILWRLDTLAEGTTKPPGTLVYGDVPDGSLQVVPAEGDAPELEEGTTYKLFVLRDFGPLRLANCNFVFGQPVAALED